MKEFIEKENQTDVVIRFIFYSLLFILYSFYVIIFLNIINIDENIIRYIINAIHLFVCLVLLVRFFPFNSHNVNCKPIDKAIIFSGAFIIFSNISFVEPYLQTLKGKVNTTIGDITKISGSM